MLAQATQKLIEAVKPLLGSPAHEFGHLLADRVKFWRFKQAVQIVTRANEIREAKGVKHEVDLKFFLPFLEECSKENDENISEMWSQLLASSSGQDTGFDLICVEYLSKLGKKKLICLRELTIEN